MKVKYKSPAVDMNCPYTKSLMKDIFILCQNIEKEILEKGDDDAANVILSALLNLYCNLAFVHKISLEQTQEIFKKVWGLRTFQHSLQKEKPKVDKKIIKIQKEEKKVDKDLKDLRKADKKRDKVCEMGKKAMKAKKK